ncbi:serine/arginine-rich SC35-like splicing factor SCL33 isoform X1 [Cucurbita moschata]|uniref:Serine/arginine-rich SC35-like splicing factor SCL33 isoform X1 n=2 Tax=Cucurbita moschata TaxID=3662 RepID=A0A6J1G9Y3_CUCMO|nr:serine/arginine-rich SC35-like splicing factor SCL33 isoform X1 [Cucurbita moschata]
MEGRVYKKLKMRGRSYSYSPSPPRSYGRRNRSLSPRGHGGRGRDLPTSLLVRNLRHDCRPEDLRGLFGRFGPLKDIYLPRDYYSGKPRGFGFVQYIDPSDAADAKYELDGQVLLGRELTVVFAEENRKRPEQMRARDSSSGRSYSYRRSPLQYSQSPPHGRKYSPSPEYYSPARSGRYSRSISPRDRRYRERSYSRSPYDSRDRGYSRSRSRSRSYSRSYSR